MSNYDAGAVAGCVMFAGIILLKIAFAVAVVYVAVHFITKYW